MERPTRETRRMERRVERRMRRQRHGQAGAIVAATWLIGLGSVFLIRDAAGWSWDQAWPLFIILLGVASGVSDIAWRRGRGPTAWTLTWPVVLVAIGVAFLLATTDTLGIGLGELIGRWWPVGLLVLGAWFLVGAFWRATPAAEELSLPLAGAASADIRVRFGAGELSMARSASGSLVDGRFAGGVVHRERGSGAVDLSPDVDHAWGWVDRPFDWQMGITGEVPLDLRLETGAARVTLDASDLLLRSLRLQTGASQTRVALPRAAGETRVSAEAGAAEVVFSVPAGVAARVRSRVALGTTQVDTGRFPRTTDGYESPDYATAEHRVEIDLQGGVGTFRVVGG